MPQENFEYAINFLIESGYLAHEVARIVREEELFHLIEWYYSI